MNALDFGSMHQPSRPTWKCSECGLPWPCDPAWRDLRERLPSAALGVYMATMVGLAAGDMPESMPAVLYVRFIEPTGRR